MSKTCINCNENICIDVVIPTYKPVFEYLETAINSVIGQSHNYCNLILVIDQNDNLELEQQVSNLKVPRFKVLVQKNAGQSVARNVGINEAKANFIALLDHDDYWLPSHLELLAKATRTSPNFAIYFSGVNYLNLDGKLTPAVQNSEKFENSDVATLLSDNLMVWPSSMLINKEALGPDLRFNSIFRGYEDDDFLIRITLAGKRIKPDTEHRTTIIRDHSSRHSYREGMGDSAALFEAEYAELASSLGISNAFAKRFLAGYIHVFRKYPNKKTKKKLFIYVDSMNSRRYLTYIKYFRFLPPKPLGILVNTGIRIRKFFK